MRKSGKNVLSQVLDFYRGSTSVIENIDTDAEAFFRDTTYPTEGMKTVLSEVFGRISGDNTLPAIHRLETVFGGGKTHALIACTHLAHLGTNLAAVAGELIVAGVLPEPGTVAYGVNRARMDEQDFDERHAEREGALVTAVTQSYASLWYPSASGKTVRKEIETRPFQFRTTPLSLPAEVASESVLGPLHGLARWRGLGSERVVRSSHSAFVKNTGARFAELACFLSVGTADFLPNQPLTRPNHAAFPETGHLR